MLESILTKESLCLLQVFKKWAAERSAERQRKRDEDLAERKRKGILSGREIFSEVRDHLRTPKPAKSSGATAGGGSG